MDSKKRKLEVMAIAMILVLTGGTANAQHWRWHHHPHRVVTVVARPAVTVQVSNHFNQKERLAMAVAYIKNNGCLTVKQYARITQLSKAAAEAELEAFASDKDNPVIAAVIGKEKVYILKGKTQNP